MEGVGYGKFMFGKNTWGDPVAHMLHVDHPPILPYGQKLSSRTEMRGGLWGRGRGEESAALQEREEGMWRIWHIEHQRWP